MIQENGLSSAPVHGIVRLPPPYYDEDGITIYCGDCLEILPFIESVDVTFSSPPYNTIAATTPSGMMKEHNHKQNEGYDGYADDMPVRPYYSDDRVTIYHGDSRVIWPMLPKCDLLLTDPPYGIAFNATEQQLPGATERDRIKGDDDIELARWLCGMLWHADEAVIFGANCFPQLLPHRGRWICWDKRITEAADKMLGSAFELAWCSRTSGFDRIVRKLHGGVVNADGGKRVHPTQKPSGLFKQIIGDMFPKAETIVDPFMGSGSVLLAAKLEGRKAIGIEVEEQYCEAAAKRLSQGVLF